MRPMDASCIACGRGDNRLSGYCTACGGIRIASALGLTTRELGPAHPPTPVRISRVPKLEGLTVKFEGTQPSGSFKDRVMAVLVAKALVAAARGAVVASSGNAAIAASAACAAVGLPLLALVPSGTQPERTLPIEMRGAAIVRAGEEPSALFGLAARLAAEFGLADLASTFASPGCEWACRQIGRELADQVTGGIQTVVSSISVGPVLVGTGNGLVESGSPPPALVGVQAAGCSPIATAFERGLDHVEPWTEPVATRAVAIADRLSGYPGDGTYALFEIRRSGGFALTVDDEEIEAMRRDLALWDGLDVEFSSCAAPAAWRKAGRPVEGTVCILTGHGIKDTLRAPINRPHTVAEFAHESGAGERLTQAIERWMN